MEECDQVLFECLIVLDRNDFLQSIAIMMCFHEHIHAPHLQIVIYHWVDTNTLLIIVTTYPCSIRMRKQWPLIGCKHVRHMKPYREYTNDYNRLTCTSKTTVIVHKSRYTNIDKSLHSQINWKINHLQFINHGWIPVNHIAAEWNIDGRMETR
jgi:hypothetical protein